MTNQVLPPPDMEDQETRSAPYEPHLWNPVVDEPVWRTWLTDLRGMFQREHLPPLVLTSQPVAVPDPFRVKRSPMSSALSVGAHVAIIGLIIFLIIEARMHPKPVPPKAQMAAVDITPFRPIAPKGPAMVAGLGRGRAQATGRAKAAATVAGCITWVAECRLRC